MPIYEYQCTHCNNQFDLLQKLSDPTVTKCPQCSQETAIRLVSAASFQLKGSGWYVTDFKNKDQGSLNHKKETSNSSGSSGASSTTAKTSESSGSDTHTKTPLKKETSTTEDKKSKKSADSKTTNKQSQGESN